MYGADSHSEQRRCRDAANVFFHNNALYGFNFPPDQLTLYYSLNS
jgi:hypothetical protein